MFSHHKQKLDAAALLYQRHGQAIFTYLRRHTPTREDAEDVLVEVFLACLENCTFEGLNEKEQGAWLWRVARNKAIDHFRRAQRRPGVFLEHVAETVYDDDELEPEQVTLRQEEYRQLRNHLDSLSPLQQEVLRLRFANDLPCAQIAAIIGKREGTVRVILSRTLNLLRGIYEQQKGNR